MDWVKDGPTWPNSDISRFVSAGGARWHLQQMGQGPQVLLIHGTGATTHSFADMMPILAEQFHVTAIDLPGHGFTSKLDRQSPHLRGVSEAIAALLKQETITPELVVGHSAGAAIAVYMASTQLFTPRALAAINGAFYPFPGVAEHMFPAMAKLLFLNPFVPRMFAASANSRRRVSNLVDSTGSKLSDAQLSLYQRALTSRAHVEGTLALMANWELGPLQKHLRALEIPVLQVVGENDGTIPVSAAKRTQTLLQNGELLAFDDSGHLVHEERPAEVAHAIARYAAAHIVTKSG